MTALSRTRTGLAAAVAAGTLAALASGAAAQTKVPVPALTFPTVTNTANDIIIAKGFDKANGIQLDINPYGAVGAQYSAIAKAEVVAGVLAPYQVAKFRSEGVPVAIYATFIGMDDTQIVTTNPAIKTIQDLKGKSIAATVGFSSYQYLQIYTRKYGLTLGTDLTVVNANTALAQAQLEAGRVDSALLWEPATTRALTQLKDARVVINGDEAWRTVTGDRGWDIIAFINLDYAKKTPGVIPKLVAMYKSYAAFVASNPEEADAIITSDKYTSKGIPPGSIATAVKAKRFVPEINPSWEPAANKQLWQMMELGVQENYITTPPRDLIYNEPPAS